MQICRIGRRKVIMPRNVKFSPPTKQDNFLALLLLLLFFFVRGS